MRTPVPMHTDLLHCPRVFHLKILFCLSLFVWLGVNNDGVVTTHDVNSTLGINYWPPPRSTTYARHHLARTRTYYLILNTVPDLTRCNWHPFVWLSLFYFVFHLRVSCPEQRLIPVSISTHIHPRRQSSNVI